MRWWWRLLGAEKELYLLGGLVGFYGAARLVAVATVMGTIVRHFFAAEPVWTMAFAAAVMVLAAISMLRVKDEAVDVEA